MKSLSLKSLRKFILGIGLSLVLMPAYASSSGNLPFNTSLDTFKASFIAAVFDIAVILLMATCLMLAFGEWGDGIKRFITIVFFISLALAAPTGVILLFGTGAVF
jgi:type IV secretory pathway VirB2 component (pilin)